MIVDIQILQRELEGKFMAEQPEVELNAVKLYAQSPMQAREYLAEYSATQAGLVLSRWKKLGEFLLWKYLDGNLHIDKGLKNPRQHPRYPDEWYRRIVREKGELIKVPEEPSEH